MNLYQIEEEQCEETGFNRYVKLLKNKKIKHFAKQM